jgi:hypothetical protein
MNGEDHHCDSWARKLWQVGEKCGATVTAQQSPRRECSPYLLMEKGARRIVCSLQTSWRGCLVGRDVSKAATMDAQLLLITTPDSLTAQACRRQLRRRLPEATRLKVIACPLTSALEILHQTLNAIADRPNPTTPDSGKET